MEALAVVRAHWDRVLGVVALVAGGVVLLLGYLGISGTSYPAEQLPYVISGGLVGLVVAGVGATLWLSADLRDEWLALSQIQQELARLETAPTAEQTGAGRRRSAGA